MERGTSPALQWIQTTNNGLLAARWRLRYNSAQPTTPLPSQTLFTHPDPSSASQRALPEITTITTRFASKFTTLQCIVVRAVYSSKPHPKQRRAASCVLLSLSLRGAFHHRREEIEIIMAGISVGFPELINPHKVGVRICIPYERHLAACLQPDQRNGVGGSRPSPSEGPHC